MSKTSPDRVAALKAWLAYHGISNRRLAEELSVSDSMISRIISGQRAPSTRLNQLMELGVPVHLLPDPSGRPWLRRAGQLSFDSDSSTTHDFRVVISISHTRARAWGLAVLDEAEHGRAVDDAEGRETG
mgnify:CR=1 FL=1